MKTVLALAITSMLGAAVAAASPTPMVTPPAGWHADPERGSELTTKVQAMQHFGGASTSVAVETYGPAAGTIALVVTRATADKLPGTREQAVRAELRGAEGTIDDAMKVVRATHTQTQGALKLDGVTLMAADGDHLVAVTGECLDGGTDPALTAACAAALRTLDPGIPAPQRIALGIAATDAPPTEPSVPTSAHGSRDDAHAQFRDGTKVTLPTMEIPRDQPATDRRPMYIGAGLIVMAAVFYWNRRRRDRFERDDRDEPTPHDDDDDDLHAAARGAAKDDE